MHTQDMPQNIPYEASLCLFRVLQEALQNAAKHSGADHFQVMLCGTANELQLTVGDSGNGFDLEGAVQGSGLGIISMRERLKLVGGQLSIDSHLGAGSEGIEARGKQAGFLECGEKA